MSIKQAVVLAAGLGTRLRPITDHTPKALVPFYNVPLVDYALAHLTRAGVERVAVNLHHLPDPLERHVRRSSARRFPGLDLHFRREAAILGTGGGVKGFADWLDEGPLWVFNADIVTTVDLRAVAATHQRSGAEATLIVTRGAATERVQNIRVEAGRLSALIEWSELDPVEQPDLYAFCGISVLERDRVERLPEGHACLMRQGFVPWIAAGAHVGVHAHADFWADLGTPSRYLEAHRRGFAHLDALRSLGLHD